MNENLTTFQQNKEKFKNNLVTEGKSRKGDKPDLA